MVEIPIKLYIEHLAVVAYRRIPVHTLHVCGCVAYSLHYGELGRCINYGV